MKYISLIFFLSFTFVVFGQKANSISLVIGINTSALKDEPFDVSRGGMGGSFTESYSQIKNGFGLSVGGEKRIMLSNNLLFNFGSGISYKTFKIGKTTEYNNVLAYRMREAEGEIQSKSLGLFSQLGPSVKLEKINTEIGFTGYVDLGIVSLGDKLLEETRFYELTEMDMAYLFEKNDPVVIEQIEDKSPLLFEVGYTMIVLIDISDKIKVGVEYQKTLTESYFGQKVAYLRLKFLKRIFHFQPEG